MLERINDVRNERINNRRLGVNNVPSKCKLYLKRAMIKQ